MRQRYIIHWSDNKCTHFVMKRRGHLSLAEYGRIAREGKADRGAVPVSIQRYPL